MRTVSESMKVIKLAVFFEDRGRELFKIDQSLPLAPQIQDVCNLWGISAEDASNYALQFDEEKSPETNDRYITESNRAHIKTGSMLKLTLSPEMMSEKIAEVVKNLRSGSNADTSGIEDPATSLKTLEELVRLSIDQNFIAKFNRPGVRGLDLLVDAIQSGRVDAIQSGRATGKYLELCLQAFVNLMVEGARQWEDVSDAFVKKLVSFAEQGLKNSPGSVIHSVLVILENLVLACPEKFELVMTRIAYPTLANYLETSTCRKTRQAVVALINALLQKAPTEEIRQQIGRNVCHDMRHAVVTVVRSCDGGPWAEMHDQLYLLQTLLLGLNEARFMSVIEPGSADDMDKIKHLRRVAFDEMGVCGPGEKDKNKRDHYHLGFSDESDPLKDFAVPPARLALDCLTHYADNHERHFARMAIENSLKDSGKFPLVETGVKLVSLLCDVLEIRSTVAPLSQDGSLTIGALGGSLAMRRNFQPMFFSTDYPLEELFCRTMDLFGKTWKEMKATVQDMDKVMNVVREQLERALDLKPPALDFEAFAGNLETLSYAQIKNLWEEDRKKHEKYAEHSEPIRQLRDALRQEIISIIAEQRTLFLTDGSRFIKTSGRGRLKDGVKYWFCRLAPNRKAFHYGDCKEEKDEAIPSVDNLPSKLELNQLTEHSLVVGDKCPHFNKGKVAGHYFSLKFVTDAGEQESLNFISPDEKTFHYWCDGINALLKTENAMESSEFVQDMEILLSMEVKLRLLDVGALKIPDKAPEVPPLPKKYLSV